MKKLLVLLVVLMLSIIATGCNWTTKNFGGTMTYNLEPGQKLENVTWKDDELWMQTRPMREGEVPETHQFFEKSNMGILEGTVIIKESAK